MGHIKEPSGVDFVVDPQPITKADLKAISDIFAHYKATGKILTISKAKARQRVRFTKKNGRFNRKSNA